MTIKTNKVAIEIPSILVVLGLLTASNIYANHCRKKVACVLGTATDVKTVKPEGTEENKEKACE